MPCSLCERLLRARSLLLITTGASKLTINYHQRICQFKISKTNEKNDIQSKKNSLIEFKNYNA